MKELSLLKSVIREAGDAAMKFYGTAHKVDFKGKNNPVTDADLASEKVILHGLEKFGYGILSEETEDDFRRLENDRVWIIDPLDGTKDFIQETGEFSIMVALVENGEVVLGAVYQPVGDKLYYAEKGKGAYLEEGGAEALSLKVSNVQDFADVRMLVSRNHLLELEKNLSKNLSIGELVTCGSAGLKSSLIAEGAAELYINSSDKTFEWDICAADIIVSESGAKLTDMDGNIIFYNKKDPRNLNGFVVSNGGIHQSVLDEIKKLR